MSNTPSDAEILALAQEQLKAFAQFVGAGEVWFEGEIEFARAVLAKWGTPQPVPLGFTIENRAGIYVLVWEDGGCQPATSAEVAMWKALAAVQQPVVREPLKDEQIAEMMRETWGCASIAPRHAMGFARAVLAKWGAPQPVVRKPLTDEQVEALITTVHFREGYELKASVRTCLAWYRLGLRDGERAHGIGEQT